MPTLFAILLMVLGAAIFGFLTDTQMIGLLEGADIVYSRSPSKVWLLALLLFVLFGAGLMLLIVICGGFLGPAVTLIATIAVLGGLAWHIFGTALSSLPERIILAPDAVTYHSGERDTSSDFRVSFRELNALKWSRRNIGTGRNTTLRNFLEIQKLDGTWAEVKLPKVFDQETVMVRLVERFDAFKGHRAPPVLSGGVDSRSDSFFGDLGSMLVGVLILLSPIMAIERAYAAYEAPRGKRLRSTIGAAILSLPALVIALGLMLGDSKSPKQTPAATEARPPANH